MSDRGDAAARGVIPGTEGYAREAPGLIERYEALSFEDKHGPALPLLPAEPGAILDIGAGTGADAAWFAARGHRVVAAEPTRELREAGERLHRSPAIEWLDDGLPTLRTVRALDRRFDAVMLTAVWMHLDANEREAAMPVLAALLAADSVLVLTLRHGPVPPGRRMFAVGAGETIALAERSGLRPVLHTRHDSLQPQNRAQGVTWTRLAFRPGEIRA